MNTKHVNQTISIGGRNVGPDEPCFIIAEAGINHNGRMDLAYQLIDAAVEARADAVKFQTFKTEFVMVPGAPKAAYQKANTGGSRDQFEMAKEWELPFEDFRKLADYCRDKGIMFLSTAFDHESLDFLVRDLDVAAIKVPSGEVVNIPYLRRAAAHKRPVILSTGMADLGEVETALKTLTDGGANEIVVLHCVSAYPTPPQDVNLRAMVTMAAAFQRPTGFSDHTLGIDVALGARALGACVLEKHFTVDRTLPGPDQAASLEPGELAALVSGIRRIEAALGDGLKKLRPVEEDTRNVARRSLRLTRELRQGDVITEAALVALRPSGGISPASIDDVVGKRARGTLPRGHLLQWKDIE